MNQSSSPSVTLIEGVNWGKLSALPAFMLAVAYGGVLASLPLLAFQDRANYLNYATDSLVLLGKNVINGPVAVLANEPVWLLVNWALGVLFTPAHAVRLLIFTSALVMAFEVLRHAPSKGWAWALPFLLMPQLLDNYTTHLREGCGLSIFLAGWFSESRYRKYLLLVLSPLVHSSYFVVLALYLVVGVTKRLRLANDVQVAAIVTFGAAMSVGLVWLGSILGARQASEYQYLGGATVSGLGFVFWLAVLLIFLIEGSSLVRKHALAVGALVFYLTTYFFLQFTGRIFEAMLLLVLLAGLELTSWRKFAFVGLTISWVLFGWMVLAANPTMI
ncbi:MAG TPA: EpsG family protein [Steroidobacteraceae bacterium]|nr:EpsG family protein [Steroidobacteraceae bacterium]